MPIKRILVTGAAGLLGTEICRQLRQDPNTEVWALDNHSRSTTIPHCDVWFHGDLRNPKTFEELPTEFTQVYHYSAINGTKNFYERPNEVLTNNFISDINVFEWATTLPNLEKLVYASTSEIVSDSPVCPTPEETDVVINDIHNARWSYRIAKIASENYLANSKLPWVVVRYFNIYGADSKAGHFIADQIEKIQHGEFVMTGGDETRSFCYIEDGVRATIHVANNAVHEVVNVGNDRETSILEAANTVARSLGHHDIKWEVKPGLSGSTKRRLPNIDKLRLLMPSYQPRTFSEGMAEVIAKRKN